MGSAGNSLKSFYQSRHWLIRGALGAALGSSMLAATGGGVKLARGLGLPPQDSAISPQASQQRNAQPTAAVPSSIESNPVTELQERKILSDRLEALLPPHLPPGGKFQPAEFNAALDAIKRHYQAMVPPFPPDTKSCVGSGSAINADGLFVAGAKGIGIKIEGDPSICMSHAVSIENDGGNLVVVKGPQVAPPPAPILPKPPRKKPLKTSLGSTSR